MEQPKYPIAIPAAEVPLRPKSSFYPEPFASRIGNREKRALGDVERTDFLAGFQAPRKSALGTQPFVLLQGRLVRAPVAPHTRLRFACRGKGRNEGWQSYSLRNQDGVLQVFD